MKIDLTTHCALCGAPYLPAILMNRSVAADTRGDWVHVKGKPGVIYDIYKAFKCLCSGRRRTTSDAVTRPGA